MDVANKILLPQANVMMFRRDSGGFVLPFDLERGLPVQVNVDVPPTWIRTPGPLPCISKGAPGPLGCMPPEIQGPLSPKVFNGIRINNILSNILSHVDPQSDYNVFFVRRVDEPNNVAGGNAYSPFDVNKGLVMNVCFCSDNSGGQVLAHELGHFLLNGATFLTRTGHTTGANDLMMEKSLGPFDIRIPKQQANFMNPSGSP